MRIYSFQIERDVNLCMISENFITKNVNFKLLNKSRKKFFNLFKKKNYSSHHFYQSDIGNKGCRGCIRYEYFAKVSAEKYH